MAHTIVQKLEGCTFAVIRENGVYQIIDTASDDYSTIYVEKGDALIEMENACKTWHTHCSSNFCNNLLEDENIANFNGLGGYCDSCRFLG
jgi:hypothetical protein